MNQYKVLLYVKNENKKRLNNILEISESLSYLYIIYINIMFKTYFKKGSIT